MHLLKQGQGTKRLLMELQLSRIEVERMILIETGQTAGDAITKLIDPSWALGGVAAAAEKQIRND